MGGLKNEVDSDNKLSKTLLLGIITFIVGTFTLDTFVSSLRVEVLFLTMSFFIFIIYYLLKNKELLIHKIELMWFVFLMYFIVNILYQGEISNVFLVDLLVFSTLFLFPLLIKIDIDYYIIAMRIMAIMAVIYALSSIFQYLNMDLYTRIVLPLFNESERMEILKLYRYGTYTGLTWQTAFISGYLTFGIGIILLSYQNNANKISRFLTIIAVPLLLFSLVLGGKRAHLFFMIIALITTYLFSSGVKRFLSHLLRVSTIIISLFIGLLLVSTFYTPNIDSPMGKFYNNIYNTVIGFTAGEDITSGRTLLYDYALKLFYDTPILGVGWRGFSQLSVGVLNTDHGSHPHNIYFQLLTELGLIGFILFIIPVIYILFKTVKLLMNAENLFSFDMRWKTGLKFSLYVQIFFIMYGITGNLLTDHMYLLLYIFSVTIALSSMKYAKKGLS